MATRRDYRLPSGFGDLNQMVQVIGQDGKQLGVLTVFEAAKIAKEQAADLVAIAPNAKLPVCRIVDWPKLRRDKRKRRSE
jgi:translation initiation factor IF-3